MNAARAGCRHAAGPSRSPTTPNAAQAAAAAPIADDDQVRARASVPAGVSLVAVTAVAASERTAHGGIDRRAAPISDAHEADLHAVTLAAAAEKSRASHTADRSSRQARSSNGPRAFSSSTTTAPSATAARQLLERSRLRRRGRGREPARAASSEAKTHSPDRGDRRRAAAGLRRLRGRRAAFTRSIPAPRVILTSSLDGSRFRRARHGQLRARLHSEGRALGFTRSKRCSLRRADSGGRVSDRLFGDTA